MNNTTVQNNPPPLPSQADPKAAKEKATEEKYQLMSTIQAIRQGKMPHNAQLEEMLNKMIENQVIQSRENKISEDGKILLNDFRELLQTIKKALNIKNKDELFQSMVYHLHCMESPISKDDLASASKKNADMGSMKSEGKKASDAIWKIGDSLKGAGDSLQDDQNKTTGQSGKDIVDSTFDSSLDRMSSNQPMSSISPSPRNHRSRASGSSHIMSSDLSDTQHVGLLDTGDSVHPSAMPHNQATDKYNEQKGQATNKFNEKKEDARQTIREKVPKEKQDELIHRLQEVLGQIQKHSDYQGAIETLIGLIKTWSGRVSQVSGEVKSRAKEQDNTAHYREQAEREFRNLVEAWAQGHSLDSLLNGVRDVMNDVKQDDNLREYYHNVVRYVERLVREPGYATKDESTEEGRKLMDHGREVLHGNYDDHLRYLSDESRRYMKFMAEDEVSREINDRITAIHRDLWMDRDGNPAFKPHLLNDMRKTLLPAFMDEIRYIPVPRIEYSDKQFDVVVENLVISGDTLLPNVFDTKVESFNSFSLRSEYSKPSSQSLMVRMSEIQADIDDVVFWYHKKSGFPKIQDRGVASLAVGGKGITIVVRVHSVADDPSRTFKVDYCKAHVDKLKVKVNDSHHDILYKTITPLLMGTIRRQMAKSIENMIVDKLNSLDHRITRSIDNFHQKLQSKAVENRDEKKKGTESREEPSSRSKMPPSIHTDRRHHLDSPPLSPTKLTHDHSNDYKMAVDLSEASSPTRVI
ncbi:hypothetical protein RO3G_06401 [Rhizopus delemar RA 99-880]|uniref:Uncharacterized protein n=1 Tax=Rhizopus delemar (strain RA 99-880 / ATCC MYA-4621 / FGSC 9543 / NRRL 43880) TaxID=246409 RepID=I1BZR6_RHIO9|nr:hypothetical protein RO3G_06401 [Rhizopus delemar RA 99-880]|eukprot:EIE81696.1 hypothetical protein RO3G_06401 [Rhizopus delemar RA 99-880]